MRWSKWALTGSLLLSCLSGPSFADGLKKNCEPHYVPPPSHLPSDCPKPPTPTPTPMPEPTPTPIIEEGLAQAREAGAGGPESAAPNLFGDTSSSRPSSSSFPFGTGGALTGRTKISEGNNPMPRDRVILDFDYFDNNTAVFGRDVRRWSPGIEKTFLDQRASIEVRMPFASTLDNNIYDGNLVGATEFGNINLTLKGLLFRGEVLNIASGLGISLPTEHGRGFYFNGTEFSRINNNGVLLTPYLAGLYTPNDRLFAQMWGQVAFDANGNLIEANVNGTGLQKVGRLNDQPVLSLDAQIGYWVVRRDSGTLRGVAPFVELHYNTPLGSADNVFGVGNTSGNYDELNLTAGVASQLGDNLLLSLAIVAPLREDENRFFDYQVGLRLNWFFGPTARTRAAYTPGL